MSMILCGILAALLVASSEATAERRSALVIGNGDYRIGPLRGPTHDARNMADALRQSGFSVEECVDCDKREMETAIRDFGTRINRGGVGLFYYAGHGMEVGGVNYLIPIRASIQAEDEIPYEAVDVGRVLSKMESASNRVNILILDACRSNPYSRSFRSSTAGLKAMDAPSGSILAYATAPDLPPHMCPHPELGCGC